MIDLIHDIRYALRTLRRGRALAGIGSADVLTITACAVATSAVAALAALGPTLRAASLTPLAAILP